MMILTTEMEITMRLDRTANGRNKYAILNMRKVEALPEIEKRAAEAAMKALADAGILDFGPAGTESEFFVIRLRDKYATHALQSYAGAAWRDGEEEYSNDIVDLADRSGSWSPFCKKPD